MSGTNQLLISANNQNGGANGFLAVVGGGRWDSAATFVNQEINMKIGATFSNMSVVYTGGLANGTTKFGVGGSAGNQIAVGQTGRTTDTTHSDTVSATNLVAYIYTTSFATETIVSVQMNTATQYALQGSGAGVGAADFSFTTSTKYTTAMGGSGNTSPASSPGLTVQQAMESPGTASQFAANISTSTSGTGTITLNKNGSSGNGTVTINSGTTGLVLDSTHTDTCSAGDLLCVSIVSTNASGGVHTWTFSYVGATSGMDCTCSIAGTTGVGTIPAYFPFGGSLTNAITQAASQSYASYGLTASLLRVTWGTTTTSATMAFQKGGVSGNQSVSWSGTNGTVVDSTHTDSVSATNLIGGSITTGSSVNISSVGFAPDDGSVVAGSVASVTGAGVALAISGLLGSISGSGAAAAIAGLMATISGVGTATGLGQQTAYTVGTIHGLGAALAISGNTFVAPALAIVGSSSGVSMVLGIGAFNSIWKPDCLVTDVWTPDCPQEDSWTADCPVTNTWTGDC